MSKRSTGEKEISIMAADKMMTLITYSQSIIVNKDVYFVLLVPTNRVVDCITGKVIDAYDVILTDKECNNAIGMFTLPTEQPEHIYTPEEMIEIAAHNAPDYIVRLNAMRHTHDTDEDNC